MTICPFLFLNAEITLEWIVIGINGVTPNYCTGAENSLI